MSVILGDGVGVFSAIDAVLASSFAWTAILMKVLMSTCGIDAGGKADVPWGARTKGDGAEKAGWGEITGDACSHDFRGDCLRELDRDVMLVEMRRLQGSWIQQIAA